MSGQTSIEWTDRTWNPLTGCTKVSPGCDNCYAKTMHERFNGPGSFDTVTLHPERLDQPLRWRKPSRVFVNSMSDLFHQDVPDYYIARAFAVMAWAPQHTFQILTKRHARMRSLLGSSAFYDLVDREWCGVSDWFWGRLPDLDFTEAHPHGDRWPLPNVWLGVSVENQQWADIRIPALMETPAAVRFLSCEPLLGAIELTRLHAHCPTHDFVGGFCSGPCPDLRLPDWVIVGGESGRASRPMAVEWARALRDQCNGLRIPFLFKQWGEFHDGVRLGKKEAGRYLDGRTWDEYPAGVA